MATSLQLKKSLRSQGEHALSSMVAPSAVIIVCLLHHLLHLSLSPLAVYPSLASIVISLTALRSIIRQPNMLATRTGNVTHSDFGVSVNLRATENVKNGAEKYDKRKDKFRELMFNLIHLNRHLCG